MNVLLLRSRSRRLPYEATLCGATSSQRTQGEVKSRC